MTNTAVNTTTNTAVVFDHITIPPTIIRASIKFGITMECIAGHVYGMRIDTNLLVTSVATAGLGTYFTAKYLSPSI